MAKQYKTPGVYVTEKNSFGSSIVAQETAIPVFIGFTEFAKTADGGELNMIKDSTIVREPVLVQSMLEYQNAFGGADETGEVVVTSKEDGSGRTTYSAENKKDDKDYTPGFMEPSLSSFFSNGGGSCYIVSIGKYQDFNLTEMPAIVTSQISFMEDAIETATEATLIVPTDLIRFGFQNYYQWGTQFTDYAKTKKKYFTILDTVMGDPENSGFNADDISNYRDLVTPEFPSYAAAYYPYLKSLKPYAYKSDVSNVVLNGKPLSSTDNATKEDVKSFLATNYINMPPSPFMAGIYNKVDSERGVWKAPANLAVIGVSGPLVSIGNMEQDDLNVDATAGKSICAIRSFTGKGTLVWGARTNDGNSADWRYIPVRRLFISMETDISIALEAYVFKPNVHNTWVEVKTMIESYLLGLYGQGAFAGTTPESSYQVLVGVGETMTDEDVLNGYMRVSILVAPFRPAEFIVLTFSQMIGQ